MPSNAADPTKAALESLNKTHQHLKDRADEARESAQRLARSSVESFAYAAELDEQYRIMGEIIARGICAIEDDDLPAARPDFPLGA